MKHYFQKIPNYLMVLEVIVFVQWPKSHFLFLDFTDPCVHFLSFFLDKGQNVLHLIQNTYWKCSVSSTFYFFFFYGDIELCVKIKTIKSNLINLLRSEVLGGIE